MLKRIRLKKWFGQLSVKLTQINKNLCMFEKEASDMKAKFSSFTYLIEVFTVKTFF